MAEINKNDIFSDEALKAPLELANNLDRVVSSIDAITTASKKTESELKGATSVSKITKQTEQLTVQEKELIKVQNQITIALAKNNQEYIEHKRGLDAINKAVKDKVMAGREDATLTGKLTKGMADLKKELKEAKNAMIAAADAGGSMSKEYQEAAKKAGELQDKVSDAKDEAKVFANDTAFGALGTRMGLLKDKLMQLDFKGVGEQLKGLGKIILANPLLLLAGIVIGIGAALYSMRDAIKPVADVMSFLGDKLDYVVQKLKDFSDWMGISEFAARDKAKAVIEAANEEVKAVSKSYDQQIAIAQAAGKDTIQLEKDKWAAIKAEADKGMIAAFDPKKSLKDQSDTYKEFVDIAADAQTQIQVVTNKGIQENIKAKQKEAEEEKKIEAEVAAYIKKIEENLTSTKSKKIADEREARNKVLKEIEKELGVELNLTTTFGQAVLNSRRAINNKITEGEIKSNELRLENLEGTLEEVIFVYQAFAGEIGNLLASVSMKQLQDLEIEKRSIDARYKKELELAGNNEGAKKEILLRQAKDEQRIAAEQLRIRQRQARYDKATALFNAGLNVSLAITKAIPNPVLIALSAALGAIQIAAIAARPIPAFAKGVKSSPRGPALVGELGRELLVSRDGSIGLTPDGPSVMNLSQGTEVIPNKDTMRLLALAGVRSVGGVQRKEDTLVALGRIIKESDAQIIEAIRENNGDIVTQGSLIYKTKVARDGSVRLIRKKIMG